MTESESEFEPVPEPSGIQTVVFEMEDEERNEELGHLMEYDEVWKAAWRMPYGDIFSMVTWCRAQGKGISAPWKLKRIFGKVPLPYAAFSAVLILIIGAQRGWPLLWVFGGMILTTLLFFFVAFRNAEYENDVAGKCHICGEPWGGKYKHPLEYNNHRGKKIKASNSGYCQPCGDNKHRFNLWNAAMSQIWMHITEHPTKKLNAARWIGYRFFWYWPFYMRERFADPRKAGMGRTYLRGEKNNPQDQASDSLFDATIMHLYLAAQNIQKMRTRRF